MLMSSGKKTVRRGELKKSLDEKMWKVNLKAAEAQWVGSLGRRGGLKKSSL